ncbi:MAG: hypothetical protein K6L76_08930 [Agarilytica sp.]
MQIYLVGGAVRDALLNYPTSECDYVVVGATPEAMSAQGFIPVGKDFPVFLHPKTKEEHALARTERKTGRGYQGFSFNAAPSVTLEEDLVRRDLTVNAIAQTDSGELIDPHNGQADIKNKILRHVSDAFREDPVRILRVARFHARYAHLGFCIAEETMALMKQMVEEGEVDHLVHERVWRELARALEERTPEMFFRALYECGALAVLAPEIQTLMSGNNFSSAPAIRSLNTATTQTNIGSIRIAAMLSTLKKEQALNLIQGLKMPNEFKDLILLTCENLPLLRAEFQPDTNVTAQSLMSLFEKCSAFRRPELFDRLIEVARALDHSEKKQREAHYAKIQTALKIAKNISASDVSNTQLEGKDLGDAIRSKRVEAITGAITN